MTAGTYGRVINHFKYFSCSKLRVFPYLPGILNSIGIRHKTRVRQIEQPVPQKSPYDIVVILVVLETLSLNDV